MEIYANDERKFRLGEFLLRTNLVNEQQLNTALKHQSQFGGKIGSILLEFDYVTTEVLLGALSKFFGVPSADLFKLNIEPSVLNIFPFEKMIDYEVLPVAIGPKCVF